MLVAMGTGRDDDAIGREPWASGCCCLRTTSSEGADSAISVDVFA